MNKKGAGLALTVVVIAVLLLVVLVTTLFAVEKGFTFLSKTMSKEALRNNQEQCKLEGQRNPALLKNDIDDYPNHCDVCPWYDSSKDKDGDYMPDECDEDPDDSTKYNCMHGMGDRNQCKKAPVPPQPTQPTAQRNQEAQQRFDSAMAAMNNNDYTTAYNILKDILTNYEGTTVYQNAYIEFIKFEGVYFDDQEKLMRFYRDGMMFGFSVYKEKLARAYSRIILAELYQNDFAKVEQEMRKMEADFQLIPLDSITYNLIAEIYFNVAGGYLDNGDTTNAIKYYKKVFTDYPDSNYASQAQTAYQAIAPLPQS